ncbi:MAG TPA: DNA helicase UvrBC [Planctomycetaceae bacterium]|nr:DNA helicase UvrBC [Planctomycetaceae bacterium]
MTLERYPDHIDHILQTWEHDPDAITVRRVEGADGRELLQMRIDMGVLQLETTGRPDGQQPHGCRTYYDHLLDRSVVADDFELTDRDCIEIDREFVQFYHRRVCWLRLHEYDRALEDADHTLALMDFCRQHSDDEEWILSHEQYRPFVLFHRTQAAALAALESNGPETAIAEVNRGLHRLKTFFAEYEAEDSYEDDELVARLVEVRESLRETFDVGLTLEEQLAEAVAREEYELAARLRDELARRRHSREA